MTLPSRLLVVDPGKATGIALLECVGNDVSIVWSRETDFMETGNLINATLLEHKDVPDFVVVCEAFIITPKTGQNSQAPWSLELIGVTRWLCGAYGVDRLVLQNSQRAKEFCPNPRLRNLGMWHRGGAGHARDALRHAVLYLVGQGWRPEKLLV